MVERLKRWESPRRKGRNDKGRGGSARQRQLKKRQKMLLKKLKHNPDAKKTKNNNLNQRRELPLLFFIWSRKNGQNNQLTSNSAC